MIKEYLTKLDKTSPEEFMKEVDISYATYNFFTKEMRKIEQILKY